jgi:hypothetical protein
MTPGSRVGVTGSELVDWLCLSLLMDGYHRYGAMETILRSTPH